MIKGTSLDFNSIHRLYMDFYNERDIIKKQKLKNSIKQQVSPYEMLRYSFAFLMPFKAFRKIFNLKDLFKPLAEMENRGEDIRAITSNVLLIDGKEDIDALNDVSFEGTETNAGLLNLRLQGSDLFKYGDVKKIGEKFPRACVNSINIESLEEFIKKDQDYKGVPIIITIDNMGELPLDKLRVIESKFDVVGVRILEGKVIKKQRIEERPITLMEYKEIRTFIDEEIIKKLYVTEGGDKISIDCQLATQIFVLLIDKIKYDKTFKPIGEARLEGDFREAEYLRKYVDDSNVTGLIKGIAICGGLAEIARNVLSCVYIECKKIVGENVSGIAHAWNQIKLGDIWVNADLTTAEEQIASGEPSGHLFMSDIAFYGAPRMLTFDKGKKLPGGGSMEVTVEVGKRAKAFCDTEMCKYYIPPCITTQFIKRARKYEKEYQQNGSAPDYKGLIPYVGSSVEKNRSSVNRGKNPTAPVVPAVPTGR